MRMSAVCSGIAALALFSAPVRAAGSPVDFDKGIDAKAAVQTLREAASAAPSAAGRAGTDNGRELLRNAAGAALRRIEERAHE